MAAPPFGIDDGVGLWAVALQASEDFNVTVSLELYQAQLASVLEVLFRCSELSSTSPIPSPEFQALQQGLTQLLEDLLQWGRDCGASYSDISEGNINTGSSNVTSAVDVPVALQRNDDSSVLALATFNRRVVALQRKCCALASAPMNSIEPRRESSSISVGGKGGLRRSQSMPDHKAPVTPTSATKRVRRVSFSETVVDRESITPRPPSMPSDDATDAVPNGACAGLPPRPLNHEAARSRRPSIEVGGAPLPFLPPPKHTQVTRLEKPELQGFPLSMALKFH